MMHHHRGTFFGDVQKLLASALHDAGKTDTEIALEIGTSVNNIIHWRRESGLAEHLPPPRPADDVPWNAAGHIPEASKPANRPVRIHTSAARQPQISASRSNESVSDPATSDPVGDGALELGAGIGGRKVFVDLEELLTTRLLVQGNSGSGKSHLLRRLLEEATGIVQQVVIDPEGDFGSLDTFGHTVIDAAKVGVGRMDTIARRVREHRGSSVLILEALDPEQQMEAVAPFLSGLFDVPYEHWHPALVVVDEAQLFAPAAGGEVDDTTRKVSLTAMTNLMCRGRKRGLAGVLATQRLAKLHKNVAAEASNFLMGRTFLDIDMGRAADLLGMKRNEAEQLRELNRGEFIGLGPAISRRPTKVKVGDVITEGKSAARGLTPLPPASADQMLNLILADDDEPAAPALRVVK